MFLEFVLSPTKADLNPPTIPRMEIMRERKGRGPNGAMARKGFLRAREACNCGDT